MLMLPEELESSLRARSIHHQKKKSREHARRSGIVSSPLSSPVCLTVL